MSRHRLLLQRLGNLGYVSLEEAIRRHIDGSGTGYEIDDVVTSGHYPALAVDLIVDISKRYKTAQYPVGISNPECFDELRRVAKTFNGCG